MTMDAKQIVDMTTTIIHTAIMRLNRVSDPLSIYVHWPFCLSKCPYCDFNSHVAEFVDVSLWIKSYIKELEYFRDIIKHRPIKSVFFGGGTPSLMDPQIIFSILEWLRNNCSAHIDEVTLEANPTSVENKKLYAFYEAGINRVSIGIQSLVDNDLKQLGRTHNAKAGIQALKTASQIFDRYSFDLIYARENQTLSMWKNELQQAIQLSGGHISLYQLTIEKGTLFYSMHQNNQLILPPTDIAADMYHWTNQYLRNIGYKRYEISNYALPNQECIHNLTYWNYDEYLGIGPGAHSRLRLKNNKSPSALMNYNTPSKWLNQISEHGHALQINDLLTKQELIEEILMMGLRLEDGITDKMLIKYTNKEFHNILNMKSVEQLLDKHFISFDNSTLKLTDKGLLMHSYIVPRLIL
jgi:putative oxygen-independent coproporphyrinogen III oxidase